MKCQLEQPEEAIADFNEAIRINPGAADFYQNRGEARFILENFEAAIKDYDQAIQLNPDYAEAYGSRASANIMLG